MALPDFSYNSGKGKFTSDTTQARALNTNFVISVTQAAFVNYSPTLSAAVSITLAGSSTSTATCQLQMRATPGSGTFTTISEAFLTNAATYTLLVGIAITDTKTESISIGGYIPPGYEVRINSTTSGTATVSMTSRPQQENVYT